MAEEKPASKIDLKDTIGSLISAQKVAAQKRLKEDEIKQSADADRLKKIEGELKTSNATETLKLQQEKLKIAADITTKKINEDSGKRDIDIQKSGLELQKTAIEAAGGVATDNKEYRLEQLRIRGEELALRKQNAIGKGAQEEIKKEEKKLRDERFKEFLGPGSNLSKGIGFLSTKLENLKGAGKGILGTLGTVAVLGALVAFLQSDTWKNLKDKIIPLLAKGLTFFAESFGEFATDIVAFFEDPSFSTFTEMFTGKSGFIIAGLVGITALLSPFKTFNLLKLGIKSFKAALNLLGKGLPALIKGGAAVAGGVARAAGGVASAAGGVARAVGGGVRAAGGGIKSVAPLLKVGLRGAATAAKFIPGLGLAVTAAMGIFDGMSAGIEEYKKSGKIGKAVEAGIAGAASGLTFGLVSQETFQKGIDGIKAGATTAWNTYKKAWVGIYTGVKTFIKDPKGTLLAVKDKITTSVSDAAGKISDTFTEITGVELPSFADVKTKFTELGTKIGNMEVPSFADVGTALSKFRTDTEELTGIKLPSFAGIKEVIEEKFSFKFSDLKLPEIPDFGEVFANIIRSILKPIVNFTLGKSVFATQPVRAALGLFGVGKKLLNFVDETGSFATPPPQKPASGMSPGAAMARGGQAGLNVIMGGSTTNNQGTIVSTNRSIDADPRIMALLNSP